MKTIINQIKKVKTSPVRKVIEQRMKEFKELGKKGDRDWFSELCFCLMTANWKAKESIEIQKLLCKDGFCNWGRNKLAKFLKEKGHRFWPQRAENICLARKNINIKQILTKEKDPRKWLSDNIRGLGFKESSHFLRNVGYTDYAIVDRHIITLLVREKVIEQPKTITPKKYVEIENTLKAIGEKARLNQAELDLYLWYIKTGKVLK